MTDHFEQTIAELQKKLREQEQEVGKTKDMINRLCEFAGKPRLYADTESGVSAIPTVIRSDMFYGQPLARAVRQILEMRQAAGSGPASVKEIYETLKVGGYSFETKNDLNAMRGLRVSLTKNVALFHKLPNGLFGMVAWYPKIKAPKNKHESVTENEEPEQEPSDDNEQEDSQ